MQDLAALARQFGGKAITDPSELSKLAQEMGGQVVAAQKTDKPKDRQSGLATLGDFMVGILKSGGEQAVNLGQMLRSIPGADFVLEGALRSMPGGSQELAGLARAPISTFDTARQEMAPTNTAQRVGKVTGDVASMILPAAKVGQATRLLGTGARILAEGTSGAAMNAVQGGSPTAGAVVGAAIPAVGAAVRGGRALLRGAGANPVVRDAVEWGAAQGIPIDAATATGAPIVRAIQGAADATPLGGMVAAGARNQTDAALTRTGQGLARSVAPSPQTALSAGESIQGKLGTLVKEAADEADTAYSTLRAIESRASGEIPLMGTAQPSLGMVVDLQPVRERLKPVYQQMLRSAELASPMGAEATALKSMDRLMRSEGAYAPLSTVDDALGELKSALRKAPDLGKGAGALRSTVAILDQQVMAAAKRAGPEAVDALNAGRQATIRKYVVADIAERLGAEPAKVTGKLTARDDTAVQSLRELQKVAQDELPKVGRAVVDDLLEKATQEGGFSKTQGIFADWQRLGDETKALLFKPETKRDLDRFFLLAKRLQESPNPSQSGTFLVSAGSAGLVFTNPMTGVPLVLGAGALSKLLHSPAGARAMTTLMSTPKNSPQYTSRFQALMRAGALSASQAGGGSQ